ncbi:MAG TPA: bifunctional precorrin-2 dehydrogenase/sirohydrochlorin ferrochelatase [Spirochaetota bacterium]|mgnify:CR=1 FL=1|nr:bifunctional precorrin-2 dehydrogenase/sirohydrochlorin ferrochelatase [Spirochaetota bacterium]HPC41831.1 bifunctional precorrin-2 dehydrogenase/sirohydrochlorin ferrochelatase [Spirochaetota bacterium]HPL17680.1 bifunctional precorrin-2 dehydrogenase/sirohydrochlorin ferrochelatase [Spirochaetota bacterium]HQF07552.1 bifunctional precorrin-2 dehydrogenase/sirohydrochlorin ferrochelatase [Spirochaetota bacterium]HQH96283.1 bifunctional precorrin-2 dehydrogenase/sirohydrochlorin ferrochelata
MQMKLYPVMINLEGRKAVVVGGGTVALRKVRDLLECGALVTVIAPELHPEIDALAAASGGALTIIRRHYRAGDCDGSLMVFSATDNERINREVYTEAVEKNILVNAVDDPPNCSFFMPSWFERNGLVVSVSTSGISPSLSARIRRDIEKSIPAYIEGALSALKQARVLLREDRDFADLSSDRRGKILKHIVHDDDLLGELVDSYKNDSVKKMLLKHKNC